MHYSAKYLEELPTLAVGQASDLKFDTGKTRIWLSRCGLEDGEKFERKVTVEKLRDGRWVTIEEYSG